MGRMRPLVALALAAALALGGCASMGRAYNADAVSSLVPGKTTEQEAVAALGEPAQRLVRSDGQIVVQWLSSEVVLFYSSFHTVMILFDTDGRMVRVIQQGAM